MFGEASWVTHRDGGKNGVFILHSRFNVKGVKNATLRVLGLGIFHCYINGVKVSDELFLPLNSEFEKRENFPKKESLSAFRIYVPEYDVDGLLKDGENTLTIHFGGGWYTYARECKYGDAKAIFRIFGEDDTGEFDFTSSTKDKVEESFVSKCVSNVKGYSMAAVEEHDYESYSEKTKCFDYARLPGATLAKDPETDYCRSDCPADKVCEILTPKKLFDDGEKRVYDTTKSTTGYPVLKIKAKRGDSVSVSFSEELKDGKPDPSYNHMQHFSVISDGKARTVRPLFFWYGFRYFEVTGDAEVECVEVVHSDVGVTCDFNSDSEILNWIHGTYLNTQLVNMHTGIPSDCPHMERRGYTGDGQLTCHAAMNMLDAKSFYRKWMQDIADSQDKISGHIQYTAPYTHSGGGPGGWGCSIIEVPYQFYRHYTDTTVLEKYYPNMLRYFDFLEEHSESALVISDKEGEWCLGDWCTPKSVVLPAPFVNNYFYVKSLMRMKRIAEITNHPDDIPEFERRAEERKRALVNAYFNAWDGNFLGGVQGANAFMLDIGLGDERTYQNLVAYYEKLGGYDTGIFGTDIVTRVLFERGNAELATRLLASETVHSFSEMKKRGATTLWEYWPESEHDRSHNHPMFGAVCAYLYDFILGIKEADGYDTYERIKIAPSLPSFMTFVCGSRTLPTGKVSVKIEKLNTGMHFTVKIPEGLSASLEFDGKDYPLFAGENVIEL